MLSHTLALFVLRRKLSSEASNDLRSESNKGHSGKDRKLHIDRRIEDRSRVQDRARSEAEHAHQCRDLVSLCFLQIELVHGAVYSSASPFTNKSTAEQITKVVNGAIHGTLKSSTSALTGPSFSFVAIEIIDTSSKLHTSPTRRC